MVVRKFLSSLSAGTVPGTGENHLQAKRKGPDRKVWTFVTGGTVARNSNLMDYLKYEGFAFNLSAFQSV